MVVQVRCIYMYIYIYMYMYMYIYNDIYIRIQTIVRDFAALLRTAPYAS